MSYHKYPVDGADLTDIEAEIAALQEDVGNLQTDVGTLQADVSTAIQSSQKGAANGVAPLNSLAKIDSTYLPSYVDDVLEYADLASLPVIGEAGIIYVTLDSNKTYRWSGSAYVEISAGPADTDALPEGSTNLYFTDARAKSAAVADAINDGTTDVAPSQNAVFDALALKSDVGHTHVAADITDFDSAAKAAAVADSISDGVTDVAPSQNAVFDALALKANQADFGVLEGRVNDLTGSVAPTVYSDTFMATDGITLDSGTYSAVIRGDQVFLSMVLNLTGSSNTDYSITSIDLPSGVPTPASGIYRGLYASTGPNASDTYTMDSPLTLRNVGGTWRLYGSDSVSLFFATTNPAVAYVNIVYTKA